jgi:hypothetical protein
MVDDLSSGQAEEIVVALGVTGRVHGKCPNHERHHAANILLMSLDILSKLILAMLVEIDCLSSDDGARAKIV